MDRSPQSSVPSASVSSRMPSKKLLVLAIQPLDQVFQKYQLALKSLEAVHDLYSLFSTRVLLALFRIQQRRDAENGIPNRLMLRLRDLILRAVYVRILPGAFIRHVGKRSRRLRRLPAHITERANAK